jgi:Predicted phosphoribosyltransferases
MQYIEKTAKFEPDYYVDIVKEWTWYMYPWNYWEDEINLVRKLIEKPNAQVNAEELKRRFIEAYGINPPINIEEILSEIRGS